MKERVTLSLLTHQLQLCQFQCNGENEDGFRSGLARKDKVTLSYPLSPHEFVAYIFSLLASAGLIFRYSRSQPRPSIREQDVFSALCSIGLLQR